MRLMRFGTGPLGAAAAAAIVALGGAASSARAEELPFIISLRFKESTQTLHASVNFRVQKIIRNYSLTGPAGAGYGGTPTMGNSATRSWKEDWVLTPPAGSMVGQVHTFTLTVMNENGPVTKSIDLPVKAAGLSGTAGSVIYEEPALTALGPIEVIYSEIAGDPTAIVPGARDAGGAPVFAQFIAIFDLALRHDGAAWAVRAQSSLAATLDQIVILGEDNAGDAFMQDGQPFQGGLPAEQYDFFDTAPGPLNWSMNQDIAFSARAKNGAAANAEKVVFYDALLGTHTIILQQGSALTGLIDNPPGSSGDEQLGNSVGGVYVLNDGTVAYMVTPITNCHSTRYPALLMDNASFIQSGITAIDGQVWDSIDAGDVGGTPDGAHYFAQGDTENADTAIDDILVVDGQIVIQEGSPVDGAGMVAADTFFTRMSSNGTWFGRGDDPSDNDWAVLSGDAVASTGAAIIGAGPEVWDNAISAFSGNDLGEWVITGNTSNADPNLDTVMVFSGTDIVVREGDPVDLDGNGLFDDDVFINGFQPDDLHLTDNAEVYFLATLRNGAGTALGDAFLRILRLAPACEGDCANNDQMVNVRDLLALLAQWGIDGPCDLNDDDVVNVSDLLGLLAAYGACP